MEMFASISDRGHYFTLLFASDVYPVKTSGHAKIPRLRQQVMNSIPRLSQKSFKIIPYLPHVPLRPHKAGSALPLPGV